MKQDLELELESERDVESRLKQESVQELDGASVTEEEKEWEHAAKTEVSWSGIKVLTPGDLLPDIPNRIPPVSQEKSKKL